MATGDLDARIAAIRDRFAAALPGRAARLRGLADRAAADPEAAVELHREAHGIAGSAATFRLDAVAAAARRVEAAADPLRRGAPGDPAELAAAVADFVRTVGEGAG
jgi:HPt (histidine-containing phosphotransfer) domain-containing protein